MVISKQPTLNDLVEALRPAFPSLNQEEQKVSVQIHRLLVRGYPLTHQAVADSLQMPLETINAMLNRWWGIQYDQQNSIVAYWGLSIEPTQHRFTVEEQTLYTWCAWDTLFLPEILQASAWVQSPCATTRTRIRLTLTPDGVQEVNPKGAVMSLIVPETTKIRENVVTHFCHYVYFFESKEAGLAWTNEHPGTFLLSMDEAYVLGRKINAQQYQAIIKRERLVNNCKFSDSQIIKDLEA